jgi:uncharacterized protein
MKILIDIGHPAHVHYFRNFIKIMQGKGHKFCVIARNKECTIELLKNYGIKFFSRGTGSNSLVGKFFYMVFADIFILQKALSFKPDLFMSFTSPYPGHVAKLINKPHIGFSDTEHAKLGLLSALPFTNIILTPQSYFKNLGSKQIRFNGFMELCSLHPNYFQPNENIFKLLGVNKSQKYAIIRFVSWNASHDVGQLGLDYQTKLELVGLLSKEMRVFISGEKELPSEFKKFQIKIPPERMHDVLYFATLFIGEGATMASECAILGTPAVYVNSLDAGTLQEQANLGLIFSFRNSVGVIKKVHELLQHSNLKEEFQLRQRRLLSNKIDVTFFMVWFIENYPQSFNILVKDPYYQSKFINYGNALTKN